MIKVRIKKRTRMTASMLASASFIGLAIWGWNLPVMTAVSFLLLCLLFLVLIVASAAGLGWLIHKLRQRGDNKDPL